MRHTKLTLRFAERNKNTGIPGAEYKAEARLCAGGHNDPDLARGTRFNAPTVSRSLFLIFQSVVAADDMDVVNGDIECAFVRVAPCVAWRASDGAA